MTGAAACQGGLKTNIRTPNPSARPFGCYLGRSGFLCELVEWCYFRVGVDLVAQARVPTLTLDEIRSAFFPH